MLNRIRGRKRRPLDRVKEVAADRGAQMFAAGAALGLVVGRLTAVVDKRRRAQMGRRSAEFFRRGSRKAGRAGSVGGAYAEGHAQRAMHPSEEPKDFDDVTLARKVETELFRPADVPKGQINVNVQNGVVQLRGEVQRPGLIDELESRARNIQGVRDVENLMHPPNTPAPMHS